MSNELTGRVPPDVGDPGSRLEWLDLMENLDLQEPLPHELTRLTGLLRFEWVRTSLCAPRDAAFQSWLNSVPSAYGRGPDCDR